MPETRLDDLVAQLPHQPPMRLVERVLEIDPGRRARATRFAHPDDWYFDGHFPGQPVIPAIALVELLAQTGGLAAAGGADATPSQLRLAALGDFRFPAAAGPGALLEATADVVARLGALIKIAGTVTADGQLVATGSLTLADVRRSEPSEPPTP
jgi:3-hydroxyacyl-[acyl-carrier-protein] dehydratase